uniref:PITH domain-containing protein n=1 Tax=Glossina pallidipes TaxID=7398 RepID=A0A1A9ZNG9_GLOPL
MEKFMKLFNSLKDYDLSSLGNFPASCVQYHSRFIFDTSDLPIKQYTRSPNFGKIHCLILTAPVQLAPREIKLFVNQQRTSDFDQAASMTSVQVLVFDPKDLKKATMNVQNLQIFVKNNQSGGEVTEMDYVGFIAAP